MELPPETKPEQSIFILLGENNNTADPILFSENGGFACDWYKFMLTNQPQCLFGFIINSKYIFSKTELPLTQVALVDEEQE